MYAEDCQRRNGDDQWERLILYVDWSPTVSRPSKSGPVAWRDEVHRFQTFFPLGQQRSSNRSPVTLSTVCSTFSTSCPGTTLSERQLSCLATSSVQSGFEVLYFTPGATWDSLMNILTQRKLNGQFVNRLSAGFQRGINGGSGRKKPLSRTQRLFRAGSGSTRELPRLVALGARKNCGKT